MNKKLDNTQDDFLSAIEKAGLGDGLKSYSDSQVSKALETRTANLTEEKKSLEDRVMELEQKIGRDSVVEAALEEAELPESYAKLIKSNSAEEIETEVKTLKEVLIGQEQKQTDEKLENGELSPLKNSSSDGQDTDSSLSDYVKNKQKGDLKTVFKDGQYALE
jgi:hypothetical protein